MLDFTKYDIRFRSTYRSKIYKSINLPYIYLTFQMILMKFFYLNIRTELSEARILYEKVQQFLYGTVEISDLNKKTEQVERLHLNPDFILLITFTFVLFL